MRREPYKVVSIDVLTLQSQMMVSVRKALATRGTAVNVKAELREVVSEMGHHLAGTLVARLAGRRVERIDVEKRWPVNWWEAFKERWFPGWLLWRRPVRYESVSIHQEVWRVCPHIQVPDTQGRLEHLEFMIARSLDSLWENLDDSAAPPA